MKMKVADIMTRSVITLTPHDTILVASKKMKEHNIGFIPITDEVNKVVGVVTDRDIVIRGLALGKDVTERLENIMTTDVITINPDAELGTAAHLMSDHQVRRLVVTDGNGKLEGVLSLGDLSTQKESDTMAGVALSHISEISTDRESNPHHGTKVWEFLL